MVCSELSAAIVGGICFNVLYGFSLMKQEHLSQCRFTWQRVEVHAEPIDRVTTEL